MEPFPIEIAEWLRLELEDLLRGNLERLPIPGRGEVRYRYSISTDIEIAAAYIDAVRKQFITDPHPNKTVRDTYGVNEATVRRWVRDYPNAFDILDPGLSMEERVNSAKNLLEHSGLHYRQVGLSHGAIRDRARPTQ